MLKLTRLGPALAFAAVIASLQAGRVDSQFLAGREATISPDGHWRAWIKADRGDSGASGDPASSLWLTDLRAHTSRLLFRGRFSENPHRSTTSISRPNFSLDGGYVYVESDAYATSPAIHQIDRKTGRDRFVVDGALVGVLRSGPLRGNLIVQQHRYRPEGGSYDPMFVYRPSGRLLMAVPRTERGDDGRALGIWLKARRWRLS